MKTFAAYALLLVSPLVAAQASNPGLTDNPVLSSNLADASSLRADASSRRSDASSRAAAATSNLASYCMGAENTIVIDGTTSPYTPTGALCSSYFATASPGQANAAGVTSSPSQGAGPAITPFVGAGIAAGVAAALL